MSAPLIVHKLLDRAWQEHFDHCPPDGLTIRPFIGMRSSGYVAEGGNSRIRVDSQTEEWGIERRDPPGLAWREEAFKPI